MLNVLFYCKKSREFKRKGRNVKKENIVQRYLHCEFFLFIDCESFQSVCVEASQLRLIRYSQSPSSFQSKEEPS
jgi:hypothetical protein